MYDLDYKNVPPQASQCCGVDVVKMSIKMDVKWIFCFTIYCKRQHLHSDHISGFTSSSGA